MGWIEPKEGRKTIFVFTDLGKKKFKEVFGISTSLLEK